MTKEKELNTRIQYLEEQVERLRFVLDQVPNYLFWKDSNSIFLGCNRHFAESAGFTSSHEIEGKSDFELPWSEAEAKNYIADDQLVINSRTPKLNIEEEQTVDGRKITLLTSKVPLMKENEIKGVIGIYSDITELKDVQEALSKQKDAAEAANIVKSNFLATVSHELRTPLNGILGILQVMLRRYDDEKTLTFVGDMKGAAESLLNLVNDILDISCLEQGRLMIKRQRFQLSEITERAIKEVAPLAQEKQLDLQYDSSLDSRAYYFADPVRIKQVLVNLLNNAIKFTDSGHVTLRVTSENKQGELMLCFEVKDTGIGIVEQKCEQIFERFVQVDSQFDRRYDGVGLGLAICDELVAAMNGVITVDSTLGKGSTFRFSIPVESMDLKLKSNSLFDPEHISHITGSILIVEDNSLNSHVLKMMLDDFDVSISLAESGHEAFQLMSEKHFDLVFLDISLPDMDGFSIAKKIRQQKGKFELPILALTAHAFESDKIACLEAGMNDVLVKPITIEFLTEKLIQWLSTRESS